MNDLIVWYIHYKIITGSISLLIGIAAFIAYLYFKRGRL